MATPSVTAHLGAAVGTPSTEATHEPTGVNGAYTFHLTLTGTPANIAADWATIVGTNFASPSAIASWDKH